MKYLIFDCGGVLVYPRMGDWNLPIGISRILGKRVRDIHTSKYLLAHRQCAKWLDEAQLVPDMREERRLRREYIKAIDVLMDWHMTPEETERLADDFTENIARYGFFEDDLPWMKAWKGRYALAVLSDAMPSILAFLKQYGIYELLDAAVISTQIGAIKPDGRMYAAILEALKAEPGECLFVDDRPCNLDGAVAAGLPAVQMARPAYLPEALWEGGPVVHSMEELNRFIERQENP